MKYLVLILALTSCAYASDDFPPLTFAAQGTSLIVTGVIDRRAIGALDAALTAHPQTTELVLQWVPGSADDEANLEMSRTIRARHLATRVPANGVVASGGTDMFLAGETRVLTPGACVGVHTWGDGSTIGSEVPESDPAHQPYLDYYDEMGIDRAFYWYTLAAAGPEEAHWMSRTEISRFKMQTNGGNTPVSEDLSTLNSTCEARVDAWFQFQKT